MAVDRPLSIRDYLEPRQVAAAGSRLSGAVTSKSSSFQDMLKNEKSKDAQGQPASLTISDYLNRRVIAKPTARTSGRAGAEGSVATPANLSELKKDLAVAKQGRAEKLTEAAGLQSSPRSAQASRRVFGRLPSDNASGEVIERSIQKAAARYSLSPDLIRGVIRAESNFQADAVSSAGAKGLMQLMPETALRMNVSNAFNPKENIEGGVRYFKYLLSLFNNDLRLSLAAYNAGENVVAQLGTIPPYRETVDYVRRVLDFYRSYKQ